MKLALPLRHDARVGLLALASGLSALALGLLLRESRLPAPARWVLAGALAAGCLLLASAARQAVVRPLRTLSNLLRALREEDFSFRARVGRGDDPLGQVLAEVNALAATLHEQRLGALEATALLRKVMAEIDVAVFAFDAGDTLRLLNRAGERLLAAPGERLIGLSADALGLAPLLAGEPRRIADASFPGATGRFDLRRGGFRQQGQPMRLLVLADVSRALRDEERQAWHRLVRVLSHEINNSLAPIRSVGGEPRRLSSRATPRPPDWEEDARRGLRIIAARSDGARALHGRVRAPGPAAASAPPGRRRGRPGATGGGPRGPRRSAWSSRVPKRSSMPTPTSSSSSSSTSSATRATRC